jgi:hypothetical protein
MRPLGLLVLMSCGTDINLSEQAKCDGVLQEIEGDLVDKPFDRDADGFVDGNVADCAEQYTPEQLDCDDGDPERHPGAAEVACSGVDEDCDLNTPDEVDADSDGSPACLDCNDNEALSAPGLTEVCSDTLDNDCDTEVDEQCTGLYDGKWDLDQDVTYSCGQGIVSVDFDEIYVEEANPLIEMTVVGGNQPGKMTGEIDAPAHFEVEHVIEGSCTETYTLEGDFSDESHFTATFEVKFSGFLCLNCRNKSWDIAGTKATP